MLTLQLGLHWFAERGGGADRMYAELLPALLHSDVRCRGLIAGSGRARIESNGMITAFAPADAPLCKRFAAIRREFREQIKIERPDLVVSHFALYAFPVVRMMANQCLPFVVHFQGPWARESAAEGAGAISTRVKAVVERLVYQRATRLIVLSNAFGDILSRDYGIQATRIRTIPPGIDTGRFRSGQDRTAARRSLNLPQDRSIVLSVRRLVQRMGLENLIDATAAIRRDIPDILVLIAGKGPLAESLQQRIDDAGLQEHVRLLGFVADDQLPIAYAAANLSIVPTVALEGFGLIVIESLASGTPVLVTPVGGLPEAVHGLSSDLIMPGSEAPDIARSVVKALDGELSMPTMGDCQAFARDNYDWQVIAPKIRAVYEEAVSKMR